MAVDQPEAESLKSSEKTRDPRSGVTTVDAVTGVGDLTSPFKPPLHEMARMARQSAHASGGTFTFTFYV